MQRVLATGVVAWLLLLVATATAVEVFSRSSMTRGGRAETASAKLSKSRVAALDKDLKRGEEVSRRVLQRDGVHSRFLGCVAAGGLCMSSERCTGGWMYV